MKNISRFHFAQYKPVPYFNCTEAHSAETMLFLLLISSTIHCLWHMVDTQDIVVE